jgi:hypothetical protein
MIKKILRIFILSSLVIIYSDLKAQGPPDPPDDPSDGGSPVGGSAPIGDGTYLLLLSGAVWCYRKTNHALAKARFDN